jgi:xanthine dehydrogenase accessory factor
MEGSVSGGCVENDVFERAMLVFDSATPQLATYGIADELGWEVGLSCGGSIDVFIEPFNWDNALSAAVEAVSQDVPAALSIAIAPSGLAGRKLFTAGDRSAGHISNVDASIALDAPAVIAAESAAVREYGDTHVFIEALVPAPHLVIGGGTHAGIHLAAMAQRLGFRVTVLDARGLFATRERFPGAEIVRAHPDKALPEMTFDERTYVAVLSHDPRFDLPVLAHVLRRPVRYIGAMGSRKTADERRASLREMGFADNEIARIHAPIGLDIGAVSPEEIALSVLAEMTAARRGH